MADRAMTLRQSTQADLSRTVAELEQRLQASLAERDELLAQRSASAEILKVINASPGDLTRVFEIILEKAHSLCDVPCGSLQLYDGDYLRSVAVRGMTEPFEKFLRQGFRITDRIRQNIDSRHPVQSVDLVDVLAERPDDPVQRAAVELGGVRTLLSVPLVRDGIAFGRIVAARQEVRPFTDEQIALLQGFADQAVIAIENARLFNETRAALERQTATAEVLQVISNSISDAKPVFDRILESTRRLMITESVAIFLVKEEEMHCAAISGPNAAAVAAIYPAPLTQTAAPVVIAARRQVCYPDVLNGPDVPASLRRAATTVWNYSIAMTPLMWEGNAIGLLSVTREAGVTFSDKELSLLRTFGDQAVIAIENARLFNETREGLERQTATAEILQVIASSPSDVQPIFDAIVKSAAKLFGPCGATITTLKDGQLHFNATGATLPGFEIERARAVYPIPFDPQRSPSARAILERRIIEIPDVSAPDTPEFTRKAAAAGGFQSITFVPLVHEDHGIGTIILSHPQAGFRLSEKQLALLKTFADQAVIAIQNARLFNETQEALERQTSTADILKVIASSPSDVQPVFQAIAGCSHQLLGAHSTAVWRFIDDAAHLVAFTSTDPAGDSVLQGLSPLRRDRFPGLQLMELGESLQFEDTEALESYLSQDAAIRVRDVARARGYRSQLLTALVSGREPIGFISVARKEPGTFAPQHVQLLKTFADQAVIAIQNARLFNETREALEQQTATAEVLKVISASPGELEPVFQAMLANAVHLCEAKFGMLFLYENNEFRAVGKWNLPPAYSDFLGKAPIRADPKIPMGRVLMTKQPVQVADVLQDQSYIEGYPGMIGVGELGGARTLLQVPLLKDNDLVGTIAIYRQEVRPFNDKQVALVQNFAAQAVIAIENARLLSELRQRTDDLTRSLDDLRAAQDRLVQTEKLASLGQLTAGIAHEIKNPLNFVNNFSALSAELIDELEGTLAPAALDQKLRGEIGELTAMLKSNLEKVVQHGKRADSIVKNMLLHSREGGGEHRPADINALVEESLNLAYHGARAEKSGFHVTLKRELDPDAGMVELYPQEITRVLLNLVSNGFYAVTKRKEATGGTFEPILCAATKSFGDRVEIRIRDNGTGIPLEVKEKMFNPFFTTKPAGEGTGLGLSMSHDIIVKQHGGKIDVETEPGVFTEFVITLPRNAVAQSHSGGTH
jgi:two-component system, NtrC family, sensor kinase